MPEEPVVTAPPVVEIVSLDAPVSFRDALSKVDLSFSEDGEIEITDLEEDEEPVADAAETPEAPPEVPAAPAPDPYEKRFKDTERAFHASQQELATLKKVVAGLTAPDKPPPVPEVSEEALQEIISNPSKLKQFITDVMAGELTARLAPHEAVREDHALRRELETAMGAHEDFTAYSPVIQKLLTRQPTLTFEDAYQIVKDLGPPPKPALVEAGLKTPPPKVLDSAERIRLKAQAGKLTTERGVSTPSVPGKQAAKTLREAFGQALEEHGLG